MVEILLGLITASREGDWMLHLACIRAMIPWCFAYDQINYARYLPYYYSQMSRLPDEHPDVHAEFMQGSFSVELGSKKYFWPDLCGPNNRRNSEQRYSNPRGNKGLQFKSRFGVYRNESIKNAERANRGSSIALQYRNIAGGHHIQQ